MVNAVNEDGVYAVLLETLVDIMIDYCIGDLFADIDSNSYE